MAGCGKKKGFQLALDTRQVFTRFDGGGSVKGKKRRNSSAFKVFITEPGGVTSKVPFTVDPSFYGEHNFYLHGIHHVKTTEAFRKVDLISLFWGG